jgi:phospholipid/cholesterol/gamma-HCH transport system permease protein
MTARIPSHAAARVPWRWLLPLFLGRLLMGWWRWVKRILGLLGECLHAAPHLERSELTRQLYLLGNRSLPFVGFVLGFTGAILVIQASLQAQRVIGDLSLIGPAFLPLLIREFGPTIVAMMVAARYGAGVAAEIGAMVVTEQIDALRMAGEEPAPYLVAPRVFAGMAGMLALTVVGCAIAFAAGGLAAFHGFGVPRDSYYRLTLVHGSDLGIGVVKALVYGAAVPLVSSEAGLSARGGAAGVGRATTRAVILSSLAVLALDLTISAMAQLWTGDL